MIKRTLLEVEKLVSGHGLSHDSHSTQISGVSIDTRTIQPKNLYIPIVGEKFNGHQFIKNAIENGAVATLWNKHEPNPPTTIPVILVNDTLIALQALAKGYRDELSMKVVGITGSNGKTTTKDMVASVLSTEFHVHKTEGNLNNHIGLPLTILSLSEDVDIAVLEMGMSGRGEIELLSSIASPDVVMITNIGESHLLDLGSREGIAEAKLEIITGLKNGGLLIYNGDEPLLNERVKELKIETVTFGKSENCSVYPTEINQENHGTFFYTNVKSNQQFFIPVLGEHNVHNALAALAVARHLGLDSKKIAQGLQQLKVTNMRMELIRGRDGITLINDAYNASPTSMKAAIELISSMNGFQHKVIVLGDMLELGEDEEKFHREIGEIIDAGRIHYVYTYGKLGAFIAEGARSSFPTGRVRAFSDKQELITNLKTVCGAEDLVLVKASRGMKLEEVIHAFVDLA
ncbi:UDP-N-acetylmuramoyl-tripeptide--D-alanyl-D-alanine ligase [Bacillus timonensis]|nr:UDP-N-acetylmuramoyl-tripeptide--D-alanyl-D-alanine ligase [Bacillus timonensis]